MYHPSLPVHKLDPPPEPEPTQPLPILAREAEFCEALVVPEDVHEELNILYAEQSVSLSKSLLSYGVADLLVYDADGSYVQAFKK